MQRLPASKKEQPRSSLALPLHRQPSGRRQLTTQGFLSSASAGPLKMLRKASRRVLGSRPSQFMTLQGTEISPIGETRVLLAHHSTSDLHRESSPPPALEAFQEPIMEEPLLQTCYFSPRSKHKPSLHPTPEPASDSESEFAPVKASPSLSWAEEFDDFTLLDENSFAELKARLDCQTPFLAEAISILCVGKPTIVDVSPVGSNKSRHQRSTSSCPSSPTTSEGSSCLHSRTASYAASEVPSLISDESESSPVSNMNWVDLTLAFPDPPHRIARKPVQTHTRNLSGSLSKSMQEEIEKLEPRGESTGIEVPDKQPTSFNLRDPHRLTRPPFAEH